MVPKKLSDRFFCFRFMFEKNSFFRARFFKNPPKFTMAIPIVSCRWGPGSGSRFWRFSTIFHEFLLKKMVFKVLPTHIDAEFHGESISDGFRAIRARKVGQKLKKTKKVAKLDSQVTPLSRTTPHRTVDLVQRIR